MRYTELGAPYGAVEAQMSKSVANRSRTLRPHTIVNLASTGHWPVNTLATARTSNDQKIRMHIQGIE